MILLSDINRDQRSYLVGWARASPASQGITRQKIHLGYSHAYPTNLDTINLKQPGIYSEE